MDPDAPGEAMRQPPESSGCEDDQANSLYERALSAAVAQNFELAAQLLDGVIALNPRHAEAYYKRGNALRNLGQPQAAIASYGQAILRKPDYAYAYCNRGVV